MSQEEIRGAAPLTAPDADAEEHTEVLTKAHMAERLFEVVGLTKVEAADLVDDFFEAIRQTLANNEPVKLSGFGNFTLRDKRERPGRNPKTGEEVPVTARRVVTFHAGQKLRARVEVHAGARRG